MSRHALMRIAAVLVILSVSAGSRAAPVLFTRGLMTDVKPTDTPDTGRPVTDIRLTACRGEFEPFSLAIHAPAGGSWRIGVSELKRVAGGEPIPAKQVEAAIVRWGETPGYLGKYSRVTDYCLHPEETSIRIDPGRTAWLWLTVHVPASAPPGQYRGELTLSDGPARTVVPIELRVLPLVLGRVPDVQFCLLYTTALGQYHTAATRAERLPAAKALYRELADHGMTCIAPKCSDWPYRPGHFEGLEACVREAMAAGLDGPVLWNMSALINTRKGGKNFAHFDGKCDNWDEKRDLANLTEIVGEVRRRAAAGGWPEVVFATLDEPGTQTENLPMRDLRLRVLLPETLKAVADAGARGATTMSEPVDEKHNRQWVKRPDELRELWDLSRPYCHVRIYAYGYAQGKTNLAHEQADCRRRGHEMWFYHNPASMGRDRHCARLYFGLWGWKVGAQGLTSWTYPGGRTVQWELIREGIDDFRYVAAMERLVAAKGGAEAWRASARRFLDEMKAAIRINADGFITDWAGAAPDLAAFRERAVRLIAAREGAADE